MSEYIRNRRIERAVQDACRQRGINGDVLAETPQVGTLGQQLAYVGLHCELPPDIRKHPACDAMLRAAILSHQESTQWVA